MLSSFTAYCSSDKVTHEEEEEEEEAENVLQCKRESEKRDFCESLNKMH